MPRLKLSSPLAVALFYHNTQGDPTPAELVDDYITNTIAPMLYYKFDEASGNLIDYGSEGADGTVSGATQNQIGQLGAGEVYSFDGVDDVITIAIADIPNVKALTTQRWAMLCNIDTLGENNGGVLFGYNTNRHIFQMASTNRVLFQIYAATTNANAISNINQISDCIDNWCWLFADYDHATTRKCRLFKGIGGTLTQLTLATDTASVGVVPGTPIVTDLHIGNRGALDFTFSGLLDVGIVDSGLWTTDEMQQLIDLAEV